MLARYFIETNASRRIPVAVEGGIKTAESFTRNGRGFFTVLHFSEALHVTRNSKPSPVTGNGFIFAYKIADRAERSHSARVKFSFFLSFMINNKKDAERSRSFKFPKKREERKEEYEKRKDWRLARFIPPRIVQARMELKCQ